MKITQILAFLMTIGLAFAYTGIITPLPILVKVSANGAVVPNIEVVVTNTRSEEVMSGFTDVNGEFLAEWANSELKYSNGDVFTIAVLGRTQTATAPNIDIIGFDFTECTSCLPTPTPTPTPSPTPIQCIVDKTLAYGEVLEQVSEGCNVKVRAPDFPTGDLALAILVTLSATAGIVAKISRGNSQHLHPGIKEYHSVYTMHINERIKHPKGCFDATYKKDASGHYYFDKCATDKHKF